MDTNSNYSSYYQQPAPNQESPKTPKKGGTIKKLLLGASIGLLFGIFAGLGFQAINFTTEIIRGDRSKAESRQERVKDKDMSFEDDELPDDEALEGDKAIEAPSAPIARSVDDTNGLYVNDVTKVVENVMPSVVSVNNKYVTKMNYFGQTYSQENESAGSGIIVGKNDDELLLVTNYHVVEGTEELTVTFADDEQASAQIKGTDSKRDLAVIAVQLSDIKPDTMDSIVIAKLGDSKNLIVGEQVVAIGNSLGYGQSVTVGVVSALDRPIGVTSMDPNEEINTEATFIQTDAAINPGNSGGALLNMRGQVIGINSNKIGGTVVEGMGYAIPISDAKPIIENLMTKKTKVKVSDDSRGILGITGVNVEKEYSEVYGMPVGVYVSSVTEGTGADAAGLVRGDVIVALDGEEVSSMDDLKRALEYYSAGTTVELTIMQGSPTGYKSKTVMVTLSPADSQ